MKAGTWKHEGYRLGVSKLPHVEGEDITERQAEILALYAAGRRRPEIATMLKITAKTIDGHISNAKARLGARTVHQAVAMYAAGTRQPRIVGGAERS